MNTRPAIQTKQVSSTLQQRSMQSSARITLTLAVYVHLDYAKVLLFKNRAVDVLDTSWTDRNGEEQCSPFPFLPIDAEDGIAAFIDGKVLFCGLEYNWQGSESCFEYDHKQNR